MTLDELYRIIKDKQLKMPINSYTASLFREGNDRIVQKVGEEATEVIIAAKNENKQQVITETADLIFHLLIMLSARNISFSEVMQELEKRNKTNR